MKLQLTKDTKFAVETAAEEPFLSINRENGITKDAFLALLAEIDQFISEFEAALGLSGAEVWIGERLHEAVLAGRTTVERHLTKQYFSEFDKIRYRTYFGRELRDGKDAGGTPKNRLSRVRFQRSTVLAYPGGS
jgi:hypothetical protein